MIPPNHPPAILFLHIISIKLLKNCRSGALCNLFDIDNIYVVIFILIIFFLHLSDNKTVCLLVFLTFD